MAIKKTIAVLGPDNVYLSHCTWKRALGLLESGRAIRLDATTVRLKQTKKERIKKNIASLPNQNESVIFVIHEFQKMKWQLLTISFQSLGIGVQIHTII